MEGLPDPVKEFLVQNQPAMGEFTFGGVMGYCSGMAFRRAGRLAGTVIGVGFIGLQLASSSGYMTIDWEKVRDDAIKPFDANKDGKLDMDDAMIHWDTYKAKLTDKIPSAGGFSAGFLLGARRG